MSSFSESDEPRAFYVNEKNLFDIRSGFDFIEDAKHMFVNYNKKESTEWLKETGEIIIENIERIVFLNFASKIITKLDLKRETSVLTCEIFCEDKTQLDWLNEIDTIDVFNLEIIRLSEYATKIITKLCFKRKLERLFLLCYKDEETDWIKEENEIIVQNVKWFVLYDFASKFLRKLNLTDRNNIDKFTVHCNEEESTEWIEKDEKIVLNNINLNGFILFASKFIKNIQLFEGNNLEELTIFCKSEEEIEWVTESEEIRIQNINRFTIDNFATRILPKLNLKAQNKIETLLVNCGSEEEIVWLENVEKIEIQHIKRIKFMYFATEIMSKMEIFKHNKVDFLTIICNHKDQFQWLFNIDENKQKNESFLNDFVIMRQDFVDFLETHPSFEYEKKIKEKKDLHDCSKEELDVIVDDFLYSLINKKSVDWNEEQIKNFTKTEIENFSQEEIDSLFQNKYFNFLSRKQISFITYEHLMNLDYEVGHRLNIEFFEKLGEKKTKLLDVWIFFCFFLSSDLSNLSSFINNGMISWLTKKQAEKITTRNVNDLNERQVSILLEKQIRNLNFQAPGFMNCLKQKINRKQLKKILSEMIRRKKTGEIIQMKLQEKRCILCLEELKTKYPYVLGCYHWFHMECYGIYHRTNDKDKTMCPICDDTIPIFKTFEDDFLLEKKNSKTKLVIYCCVLLVLLVLLCFTLFLFIFYG